MGRAGTARGEHWRHDERPVRDQRLIAAGKSAVVQVDAERGLDRGGVAGDTEHQAFMRGHGQAASREFRGDRRDGRRGGPEALRELPRRQPVVVFQRALAVLRLDQRLQRGAVADRKVEVEIGLFRRRRRR